MATDTDEMLLIHRFIRRELGLLPALVMTVPAGDMGRVRLIAAHGADLLDTIHVHHAGEDQYLWPLLLERARPEADLIERMTAQHADVEASTGPVRELLARWQAVTGADSAADLAQAVEMLAYVLLPHLDEEEKAVLPLAAVHMSPAEWGQLGEHGLRHTPGRLRLRRLGQILEDSSTAEREQFLSAIPAGPRLLWTAIGRRQYSRYTSRIRDCHV